MREFAEDKSFLFATRRGMVKRSSAALYARSRKGGLIAVGLREDDELIMVREITDDDSWCWRPLTHRHPVQLP